VDAEFMPFLQHERGIHAISPGTGGASVTAGGTGTSGQAPGRRARQ
jgi:hypothetical protein